LKKKNLIKIVISSIIFLAIIVFILMGLRKFLNKTSAETVIYTANIETYENVIEISGTVAAAQQQTLQALSAGTVLAVYVKAGDKVKKGDIILQLDDTTEQYNLAKHDYDMATTKISGSSKELKLKETQRLALLQKIEDRKVVATFDGVIADLDVSAGTSLEAKDSVGTLVNVDYLTADVEVAETDVSKLKVGQEVEFTFNAYPQKVKGYVESWPAIGKITSRGATVVEARIRIDEYPAEILPNYSFTGKIQIEAPVDNIIVSRYAVGYEKRDAYVVLAKTGEKKSVKVFPYGREYVKVIEGLSGGEKLLQVTKAAKSGQKAGNNMNGDRQKQQGNNFGGGGMPPMGGGMPPM